ncbi:ATP-dependent Clp protease proteolytic subunit [Sphingomonas xanthus]|nr:ATP-dependent Clp protease proteolytic subunit [Sphingomonas xanthus]
MARDEASSSIPQAVRDALPAPADIMLTGEVGDPMVKSFLDQLEKVRGKDGDIVVCCTTPGGDAEMARRIVLELEQLSSSATAEVYFLGKSVVYSAGVSIMSAFPCSHRFLTRDTMLLIHGRQMTDTIEIDGPIRAAKKRVEALLHQIEVGMELEVSGFERLVRGSRLSVDELLEKGGNNWYLNAQEAVERKLVAGIL